jgi:hypothetical protein
MTEPWTPGPWAVLDSFPRYVAQAHEASRPPGASIDPEEDTRKFAHPITEVQVDTTFSGYERFTARRFDHHQAKADARLIAAAPEMAELLENLAGWLDAYYTEAPPEFEADVDAARALLSRIRGEAEVPA